MDNSRKTIKIKFVDIGTNQLFHDHVLPILKKHYNVEFSDHPDFLIYCVWGNEHLNYENCIKIWITGEYVAPDFNECDYAIDNNYLTFGDRHLRYMFAFTYIPNIPKVREKTTSDLVNRKFCNMVSSNDRTKGSRIRVEFTKKLMQYKQVDCPGTVLHNIECFDSGRGHYKVAESNWFENKIRFQSDYKFSIAFNNFFAEGYTDDKIIEPFLANSIPIYYGDPLVHKMFNPKSFINCHDYGNFDEVIEVIKYLDNNDDAYMAMLNNSVLTEPEHFIDYEAELEKYLIHIIEEGKIYPKDAVDVTLNNKRAVRIYSKISKIITIFFGSKKRIIASVLFLVLICLFVVLIFK
jgi:hypothetical protein